MSVSRFLLLIILLSEQGPPCFHFVNYAARVTKERGGGEACLCERERGEQFSHDVIFCLLFLCTYGTWP